MMWSSKVFLLNSVSASANSGAFSIEQAKSLAALQVNLSKSLDNKNKMFLASVNQKLTEESDKKLENFN